MNGENSNYVENLTRITGNLHEDQYKFLIISCSFLLRIRNGSDKSCRENQKKNTHFTFSIFFVENHAFCEIMWKNIVEPGRPQTTVWSMRNARWTPKATNTRSKYVTLVAFPLQQWLHESASMLRCTYINCLVN